MTHCLVVFLVEHYLLLITFTMSTVSASEDDRPLRRTQSTGDITPSILRPERARVSPNYRYSESHSYTTDGVHDLIPRTVVLDAPPDTLRSPPSGGTPLRIVWEGTENAGSPWVNETYPLQLSWYKRVQLWLGRGRGASGARKAMVDFIWNISWGFFQVRRLGHSTACVFYRNEP